MIEQGITTRLTADAALFALVRGRIYALIAPQGVAAPFVVFTKVAEAISGTLCAQDPMVQSVFQIDSYAKTMLEALQIAAAVRDSMIDFRGAMGGTHVASIRQEGEVQLLDPEPGLFRVSTTLFIWHSNVTE